MKTHEWVSFYGFSCLHNLWKSCGIAPMKNLWIANEHYSWVSTGFSWLQFISWCTNPWKLTHLWVFHGYIILLQHFMHSYFITHEKITNCNFHGYFIESWEFHGNSMDVLSSSVWSCTEVVSVIRWPFKKVIFIRWSLIKGFTLIYININIFNSFHFQSPVFHCFYNCLITVHVHIQ